MALTLGFTACGDDDENSANPAYTCTTCANTPEAKAEHDNSSKGIYKGVFIGSTGVVKFDIMNTGSTATATMKIDGQTINLTTTDTIITSGQPYSPTFTGTHNSQPVSVTFAVYADGSAPTVTAFNIPGHPVADFQLAKETSDNLIKCYEGSTSGQKDNGETESGTLNVVMNGNNNTWYAIQKPTNDNQINAISGTTSGNTLTCNCGPTTTVVGTINGDEISGTYQSSDNSGTWTAKRSL